MGHRHGPHRQQRVKRHHPHVLFARLARVARRRRGLDLYPPEQREEGLASRLQGAYDSAFAALFESFDWLERLLGGRRYLAGGHITEADWPLFPTLARFDEVYNLHFRCNRRRLVDYPNLWGCARELYQRPGVSGTLAMDQIKEHYYTTHDELNLKRIIPGGPGYDWSVPHGCD